jgi:hypothetical protein
MVKLSKTIITLLVSGFAACVVVFGGIHIYYYESLPSTPDEGAGRTSRMVVNHGFVRYGSERELRALRVVEGSLPIAGFMLFGGRGTGLAVRPPQNTTGSHTVDAINRGYHDAFIGEQNAGPNDEERGQPHVPPRASLARSSSSVSFAFGVSTCLDTAS